MINPLASSKLNVPTSQIIQYNNHKIIECFRHVRLFLFSNKILINTKPTTYTLFSIFYSLYSILYTLYSILYILYSILYILFSIFYILYSIFYSLYSILYILFSIFSILHSTLYTLHSILYTLYSIFYTPPTALCHAEFISASLRQNFNIIKKTHSSSFTEIHFFLLKNQNTLL